MARRGPPWKVIAGVFCVAMAGAMALAFWPGGSTAAPQEPGACWRMTQDGGKARFDRLADDILNLETCAAYLERIHIQGTPEVVGAYQGRFIFIDSAAIRSAATLSGSRWRVFFDAQRADLDRKLRMGGDTPTVALMPAS